MKIKFMPQNVEVDLNPNKSVLNIALENGIQIHSICKGVPSCAECRIKIAEGEHNINKPSKAELSLIGNSYYIDGRRLSCQVRCFGPVTIDTSEQISRTDNPAKKIRGHKSEKQYESKAILDTMLLSEAPPKIEEVKPEAPRRQEAPRRNENRNNDNRNQQNRNDTRQDNSQRDNNRDGNRDAQRNAPRNNQPRQGSQNRNDQQRRDSNRNESPRKDNPLNTDAARYQEPSSLTDSPKKSDPNKK